MGLDRQGIARELIAHHALARLSGDYPALKLLPISIKNPVLLQEVPESLHPRFRWVPQIRIKLIREEVLKCAQIGQSYLQLCPDPFRFNEDLRNGGGRHGA